MEFQVCPGAKKGGQMDKCIKAQAIVAIVRQVGHEYTDLWWRNIDRIEGKQRKGKGMKRKKKIHILYCA